MTRYQEPSPFAGDPKAASIFEIGNGRKLIDVGTDALQPHVPCEIADALTQAILRIADRWLLSEKRFALILGIPASTVSLLRTGMYRLKPTSKSYQLVHCLLRLFLSLDSWLGQDDVAVRSWLTNPQC